MNPPSKTQKKVPSGPEADVFFSFLHAFLCTCHVPPTTNKGTTMNEHVALGPPPRGWNERREIYMSMLMIMRDCAPVTSRGARPAGEAAAAEEDVSAAETRAVWRVEPVAASSEA